MASSLHGDPADQPQAPLMRPMLLPKNWCLSAKGRATFPLLLLGSRSPLDWDIEDASSSMTGSSLPPTSVLWLSSRKDFPLSSPCTINTRDPAWPRPTPLCSRNLTLPRATKDSALVMRWGMR
jgi:hypothetical protein